MSKCSSESKRSGRHLSVQEVANRLGHCTRWVRQRVRDGQLEGYRWSRTDMTISEESVVRFEQRHKVTITTQE
jgi:hypothetical protein